MKQLIFAGLLLLSFSMVKSQSLDFGAGIQTFDFDEIGIQGKAMYNYNSTLDFAGTFTFYLDDVVDFAIDVDGHYKLLKVSNNFNLLPLVGLNVTRYSFAGDGSTEFGLNLGAMFDFVFNSYRLYAEPKIIVTDGTPFNVSAGILF